MNHQITRLGIFTGVGLLIIIGFSFYVNDQPFWYRSCHNIDITVDDATGLRRKSPVKTLGLDIGYIRKVGLQSENVVINVCITAPVKLREDTRAYVRSIGFLGDRFLELKPVDVVDGSIYQSESTPNSQNIQGTPENKNKSESNEGSLQKMQQHMSFLFQGILDEIISDARAEEVFSSSVANAAVAQAEVKGPTTLQASREAELTDTMKKVGKLVDQLTLLVKDVREATSQVEFKDLVVNLNGAAKNLATMLEPKSSFSQGVNKSMDSLRKALREFEEAMEKVNKGKGTVGKLLNDDKLYEEAVAAIKGLNLLLGKAGNLRVYVDLSAHQIQAYDGGKARFFLRIEPNPSRYYLLGVSTDPRGAEERTTTQIITSSSNSTEEKIVTKEQGIKFTAALGKYFGPLDLSIGLIENAGAVGIGLWLDEEKRFGLHSEIYKESKRDPVRVRVTARAQIFMALYLKAGVEDIKKTYYKGIHQVPYFVGAGIYFNDEDIKYLLAFK